VLVDGAVIVSTPQDVALIDVRKGLSMFSKLGIPIVGSVLNMSHFICPSCSIPHHIFGSATNFHQVMKERGVEVLAEIPTQSCLSQAGDAGVPGEGGGREWSQLAEKVWDKLEDEN